VVATYEVNAIEEASKHLGLEYLAKFNPNDLTILGIDWRTGLSGLDQRYLPYNGMATKTQLTWLEEVLATASKTKEKVILMSHIPFIKSCCTHDTLAWNYQEIEQIVQKYNNCVVACLFGHDHTGGYINLSGVHCRTFEGSLEAPVGKDCFCEFRVFSDKIVIEGHGTIASAVWEIK